MSLGAVDRGCMILYRNDVIWIALVILVFCETLSLALLLGKAVHDHWIVFKPVKGHVTGCYALGLGYYALNLAITAANLVILKRLSPELRDFLLITQGALQNLLCNRLLLHVHIANEARLHHYRSLTMLNKLDVRI
ncbi:hypothetical protein SCHPADRAFT_938885 [Schizopora paradoxa]|uniref:Uncharacterized protein n=1 Tax=Schizopora paradoxa TaxID=27342 RepID=A0A0H2RTV1_9AGAM|nr:hypothetical protein SCHPADRAFT_938885 [Schizopora paradoxa]